MKKYIAFILSCMLLVFQCSFVFAEEPEQYEMVEMENDDIFGLNSRSEVSPALLYIANVYTSIVAISSNQVGIRAETVCSEKVKTITVTYILQKWNGSKWVGIASKTASAYGVAQTSKSYTITGVSSGRYRTKAIASVTGYSISVSTIRSKPHRSQKIFSRMWTSSSSRSFATTESTSTRCILFVSGKVISAVENR